MNEEEKQAIEYLERHILPYCREGKIKFMLNDIILNLIKKQQKEIERLKNLNKNTCIRKDTIRHIRDKAECMDYYSLNDVIDDLTKLIGE